MTARSARSRARAPLAYLERSRLIATGAFQIGGHPVERATSRWCSPTATATKA